MEHLTRGEIEAIAMGDSPADDRARMHLRECGLCAERLALEARLEEALHESLLVADRGDAHAPRPGRPQMLWPAAAVLAVAAAGAWYLGSQPRRVTPAPPVGTRATATASTAPRAPSTDAPGLLDPLSFAPGYAVTSPAEYCLRTTAPAQIGPHR